MSEATHRHPQAVLLSWETLLGRPPRWYSGAACHDRDLRIWFPRTPEARRTAVATCNTCPLQPECLEYALAHVELVGIWGGRTFEERVRMRAQRRESEFDADLRETMEALAPPAGEPILRRLA